MFQNLLLIISNLNSNVDNILELVGNNYSHLINIIHNIKNKDRRVSLLKVIVDLIVFASEQLATNISLFQEVFQICRDPRSDDSMIENVLWLATSQCEQSLLNQNFKMLIETMIKCQIMAIIQQTLGSKNERLILQALKLLTKLSNQEAFRQ